MWGEAMPANGLDYQDVAPLQTNRALGGTGDVGDELASLILLPSTTSPGAVTLKDGDGTPMVLFPGGAGSLTSLAPIPVPLNIKSRNGAWTVTTGADVSVLATGRFAERIAGAVVDLDF